MPEYTQEQIDQMMVDARKGYVSDADYQKELQREVDRRVESGIQKGIETKADQIRAEVEARAKLSAEDLAKKDFEEKEKTLTSKERELAKKENQLSAKEMLSGAGISKDKYEKILGSLVTDDPTLTASNVQNFIDVFASTKSEIETSFKTQYSGVPAPKTGDKGDTSKEEFRKMTYSEKLEFKKSKPELYKEFLK